MHNCATEFANSKVFVLNNLIFHIIARFLIVRKTMNYCYLYAVISVGWGGSTWCTNRRMTNNTLSKDRWHYLGDIYIYMYAKED